MSNLIAKPIPNGYTFTLTTYALTYLLEAEQLFGLRTTDYDYVGIELKEAGSPQVWHPYNDYIVIQVSQSTASDTKQAIFEIAHEVIHLLSPMGIPDTNNLEEGLATYFSKVVTERDTGDYLYAINTIKATKYLKPYELVEKLLEVDSNAIKKLREFQPILGKITKQNFVDAEINIGEDIIEELIKPMEY